MYRLETNWAAQTTQWMSLQKWSTRRISNSFRIVSMWRERRRVKSCGIITLWNARYVTMSLGIFLVHYSLYSLANVIASCLIVINVDVMYVRIAIAPSFTSTTFCFKYRNRAPDISLVRVLVSLHKIEEEEEQKEEGICFLLFIIW